MPRFWVEFEEPQAVRGIAAAIIVARSELALRLFWKAGKILFVSRPIQEAQREEEPDGKK